MAGTVTVVNAQPENQGTIPEELLAGLNPEQRRAVTALDGPVAVIAGPGSGKTRVLTRRIAAVVQTGRAAPSRILAVTFTNKAAGEMRERIADLLGPETAERLWVATFHSFCAKFLRFEAETAGLPRSFSILDTGDVRTILRDVHRELSLPDDAGEIRASASLISRIKNGAGGVPNPTAVKVMQSYQNRLQRLGALDFDDLLLRTKQLLESDVAVRERWQRRFAYILVDEYQDTNPVQYEIVGMLAAGHRNLCVVGDADQAIYGFRAATPAALIGFTENWADATVVLLEENYRSTPEILAVCQAIIDGNESTIRPQLRTSNANGDPVRFLVAEDDREEARFVSVEIAKRGRPGATAVLVRTNAQTRSIENALMQEGLPYSVVGSLRFYERAEVKDALSYLKVALNGNDILSLARAVGVPKRGLGPKALMQLADLADGGDVIDALREGLALKNITRGREAWEEFLSAIEDVQAAIRNGGPEAAVRAILDGGVRDAHGAVRDERRDERLENLDELLNAATEFALTNQDRPDDEGQLPDNLRLTEMFLEHVALITTVDDVENLDGAVQILTAHASKGKEFQEVYVLGVEENLFPHGRNGVISDEKEERRLLFVACSRAEKRLTLTRAESRMVHGKFVSNLPSRLTAGAEGMMEHRAVGGATAKPHRSGGSWGRSTATSRTEAWGRPGTPARPPAAPVRAPGPRLDPQQADPGARVRHRSFGDGVIAERSGEGQESTITVRFADGARRQFRIDLAPIELL